MIIDGSELSKFFHCSDTESKPALEAFTNLNIMAPVTSMQSWLDVVTVIHRDSNEEFLALLCKKRNSEIKYGKAKDDIRPGLSHAMKKINWVINNPNRVTKGSKPLNLSNVREHLEVAFR